MRLRKSVLLSMVAIAGLLGACGGGSGGGGTSPVVTPPPPQPSPDPEPEPQPDPVRPPIHHLKESATFKALVASSKHHLMRNSSIFSAEGQVIDGTLSVTYHASTDSYTLLTPGYKPTFQPEELLLPDGKPFATQAYYDDYRKSGNPGWEELLLFKKSMDGRSETQHVALGHWREVGTLPANEDSVTYRTFVYGYDSPASAVPRTGTGSFKVDVYGVVASPEYGSRSFDGIGRFDVDFAAASFSTRAGLIERNYPSDSFYGITDIELQGGGKLSVDDGTFAGEFTYGGTGGPLTGTLDGRFYGPDASELGAVISADNGNGTTVTGGLIGLRSENPRTDNQSLLDIAVPELFLSDGVYMYSPLAEFEFPVGGQSYRYGVGFLRRPDGTMEIRLNGSRLFGGIFTPDTVVASEDPNFAVYEKSQIYYGSVGVPDDVSRLTLYKSGPANKELQLTYTSFGHWQGAPEGTDLADGDRVYFAFGFKTPDSAVLARTGSAQYAGVVYGTGYNSTSRDRYEVSGSSRFDVNFSSQTYTGGMTVSGKTAGSSTPVNFGRYEFGGALNGVNQIDAGMWRVDRPYGQTSGSIEGSFYGPNAEEIGGVFSMEILPGEPTAGTKIIGATVAKQR